MVIHLSRDLPRALRQCIPPSPSSTSSLLKADAPPRPPTSPPPPCPPVARARRIRRLALLAPATASAVEYRAHADGTFIPNDPGVGGAPTDWEQLQWNFVGPFGVNAPEAWANVAADGHPGGRGVIVAVLDTGVAYANRGRFRRSPDFSRYEFVKGYDFIAHNPYPNDHNGHGTFVASTIAESTNNHFGLTGLAYGVRLMPVRVLNSQGEGNASTIAEGVRFAVNHQRPGDQPVAGVLLRSHRLRHP